MNTFKYILVPIYHREGEDWLDSGDSHVIPVNTEEERYIATRYMRSVYMQRAYIWDKHTGQTTGILLADIGRRELVVEQLEQLKTAKQILEFHGLHSIEDLKQRIKEYEKQYGK